MNLFLQSYSRRIARGVRVYPRSVQGEELERQKAEQWRQLVTSIACVTLQQCHKVYNCRYFLGRKEGEAMILETKHFTVNPRKGKNCEPDFHQGKVLITLCWSIFMGVTIIWRCLYLKDIR